MGVQSLDDADLKYLGRNHSVADALRCYEVARTIFPKISFDLIYGRSPEQTGNKWRQELRKALNLNPTHLSLYTLTFEPGTPFYRALEAGKRTSVPFIMVGYSFNTRINPIFSIDSFCTQP